MSWRQFAACAGADLKLFMPDTTNPLPVVEVTAEQFCRGCPVRVPCGEEADRDRDGGLRGGIFRSGATSKYRRYPVLDDVTLAPLPIRRPGVRLDTRRAA